MRFMIIVKPPPYTGLPDPAQFEAMGRYNDELQRAGVLLDLNGLAPTAEGVRVQFNGPKRTVVDGPFAEAKEVIGGYWIIQVRSKEEAVEWAKRIPFSTEVHPGEHVEVEIRQIVELEDLPVSPERVAAKKALEQRKSERRRAHGRGRWSSMKLSAVFHAHCARHIPWFAPISSPRT